MTKGITVGGFHLNIQLYEKLFQLSQGYFNKVNSLDNTVEAA